MLESAERNIMSTQHVKEWGTRKSANLGKDRGMSISVRAKKLPFDRVTLWVELDDGRSLGVPLAWFPRLMHATADQRDNHRIGHSGYGLHWDDLDEDISIEGLLMGQRDETRAGSRVA